MELTRLEALNRLAEYNHRTILKVEVAREIAAAFGVEIHPQTFHVGEGDVLWGEASEFDGVLASGLACDIAQSLDLTAWAQFTGRGFQMRAAIDEVKRLIDIEGVQA